MATGPKTTRVVKTEPATLTHTFIVGEVATDPDPATSAITVEKADGTDVAAGAATTRTGTGAFSYALAGQADLNHYTADWVATFSGSIVTQRDFVEIVGARYFTLADARESDSSLADTSKYPTAALDDARLFVEEEVEHICDRAFVPSFRRAVLDGSGTTDLMLTDAAWAAKARSAGDIRRIRTATVAPRFGEAAVALTAGQLAACYVTADNLLRRTDGGVWTEGNGNIVIEYEYGLDRPAVDLVMAMYTRLRWRLNRTKSGIPDRAVSFSVQDGGSYRLDLPGAFKTGIPDVDAAYSRYSRRSAEDGGTNGEGRQVAASRTLTYNPQRASLFHGKGY